MQMTLNIGTQGLKITEKYADDKYTRVKKKLEILKNVKLCNIWD